MEDSNPPPPRAVKIVSTTPQDALAMAESRIRDLEEAIPNGQFFFLWGEKAHTLYCRVDGGGVNVPEVARLIGIKGAAQVVELSDEQFERERALLMARHEHQNENSRAKILAHMEVAKLAAAPLIGALSDLLRRTAIPGGKILVWPPKAMPSGGDIVAITVPFAVIAPPQVIGEVAKLLPRVLPPPSQVPIRYTAPDTTLPTWWIHGVPLNVSGDAIKTRLGELGIPIESVERIKEPTSNLPTSQVRVTVTTQEVWDRLRALGKFIDGLSVKAERKRGPAPFVRGLD
ncbi:hypothetical protein PAPYR_8817 [Paratrimastix pyriformis]|uniref:Uncharacterized protein n=2 Tax=Paratrimastix pyriformis TaxID=342808 RepID=A0ABQ8U9S2_9EUKA|nr:hypothetical protein PAPYR_8817 [Paratrimastix pyriformis]